MRFPPPRGPGVRKDGLPRAETGGGLVAGHGRVSGGLPVSPGRDALVSVRETAPCGGKLHARAVGDGGGRGGGLDAASTRSEDRDTNELVSVGRSGASASHHGV